MSEQLYRSIQIQDPADDEIAAILFIMLALENLSEDEKNRALSYVQERLNANGKST